MNQIEFDDEKIVIIHDELEEAGADDPTFGGMRGTPLDEAYDELIKELRELHANRFRHHPPPNPLDLFNELADEILLPCEEELRHFITKKRENQHFTPEEEESILKAVEKFKFSREKFV